MKALKTLWYYFTQGVLGILAIIVGFFGPMLCLFAVGFVAGFIAHLLWAPYELAEGVGSGAIMIVMVGGMFIAISS